jgi:hypothetical protein
MHLILEKLFASKPLFPWAAKCLCLIYLLTDLFFFSYFRFIKEASVEKGRFLVQT